MDNIYVIRERIEAVYGKHSKSFNKAFQFILAMITFTMINQNTGFMKSLSSPVISLGLAVVATFLPPAVLVVLATILLLAHTLAASIGIFAVSALIFLIMYIFYIRLAPKIRTYEKREVYPLTGSQKGIFAECSKNPDSTVYNIPFLFELDPAVDEQKLSEAITRMINAHTYLLTEVYLNDKGDMVQRPCNETFIPEVIHTTNAQFADIENELVRPFKLEKGRLFRAEIYLTEDRKYLFTDFHHILADGNSYDIIFEDINRAYTGEKLEKESYTGFDAALDEEQQI